MKTCTLQQSRGLRAIALLPVACQISIVKGCRHDLTRLLFPCCSFLPRVFKLFFSTFEYCILGKYLIATVHVVIVTGDLSLC
jgi:hypothetical protein